MRPFLGMLALIALSFALPRGYAEEPPPPLAEAVPTSVGTTWTYRYYDAKEAKWDDGVAVLRIVKEQIVNGRRKWSTELKNDPFNPANLLLRDIINGLGVGPPQAEPERYLNYYDVRHEAYVMLPIDVDSKPIADPILRFPYPVKPNQNLVLRSGTKTKVTDLKRKLKVPAGEFECIVLETIEAEKGVKEAWLSVDYFAVGAGLIRGDLYDLRSGTKVFLGKHELIKFVKGSNKR